MTQPVFYKDLLSGQNTYTEKDLGRKGTSLASLVAHHIPVPPFFILQPELFKAIVSEIFKDKSVNTLEEFRQKVAAIPFTPRMKDQVESEYRKLSGFGKAWVAVRSSIVAPNHPDVSFSGIMTSMLNVRGAEDIQVAIKNVINSLFSDRSYDYLKRNHISYSDVTSGIIVQKMIQAEVSGIMYTYDPITTNQEHVSIEAVFGLGDVLADGNVNPDIYTVSKKSLEIIEKKIVPQEWMKVRKMGDTENVEHLQKITISKVWQYSQKLDDALVRELTKLADSIEEALGGPQIIEWAMERGSVYVLQAKPLLTEPKETSEQLQHRARKITSLKDIDTFSHLADTTKVTVEKHHEEPKVEIPQEVLLLTGTPASPGTMYGEAIIIPSVEALTPETFETLKQTTTKKHIIVTDEFTSELEQLFSLAGGVITNFGGANSDVAVVARETHIPAIVGTRIATSFLQPGAILKIDGSAGSIYRVDFIPEQTVLPSGNTEIHEIQNAPKVEPKVIHEEKTPEPVEEKKEEKPKTKKVNIQPAKTTAKNDNDSPIKIFLTDAPFSSHAYLPEQNVHSIPADVKGIMLEICSGSRSEASLIKKLKKNTTADIYLLLADTSSFEAVLQMKRSLSSYGIRRSRRIKYVISIGSMYGLMNSKNIADLSVDGFAYNIKELGKSYSPGAKSIDENLWKLMADNLESVRRSKFGFLGLILPSQYFTVPLRKEMKPVLKKGIMALIFQEHMEKAMETDIDAITEEMMSVQLGSL